VIGYAPPATAPAARLGVALQPRRADAALDLPTFVSKLSLVERMAAMLADDDGGAGVLVLSSAVLRC
ncbi:MAG: hypothetical protein ACRENK_11750, partial [Gemmatimonadaceae bacterium]